MKNFLSFKNYLFQSKMDLYTITIRFYGISNVLLRKYVELWAEKYSSYSQGSENYIKALENLNFKLIFEIYINVMQFFLQIQMVEIGLLSTPGKIKYKRKIIHHHCIDYEKIFNTFWILLRNFINFIIFLSMQWNIISK